MVSEWHEKVVGMLVVVGLGLGGMMVQKCGQSWLEEVGFHVWREYLRLRRGKKTLWIQSERDMENTFLYV